MNLGICIGIETPDSDWTAIDSLNELKELLTLRESQFNHRCFKNVKNQINYPTLEKVNLVELKDVIQLNKIEVAIFDDELTPMQQRHIENELQIKILDRTSLVLDIFSQRARTKKLKFKLS